MPKPDASLQSSVTALLQTLLDDLDRRPRTRTDEVMTRPQTSVRCRLGPRISQPDVEIMGQGSRGSNFAGAIFMCNRRTWKECIGQSLFGLPISKKNVVDQIVPGMKLFLFEYENRQLWGVFRATSHGNMNIVPNAYSGGSFPCQVRVMVPEECVALYEEEFCEALRENYYSLGKFHFELSDAQVNHLVSLFDIKHLNVKRMHSGSLDLEEKHCISERCQDIQGQFFLGPEEHLVSTFISVQSFDRASFVPLAGAFDLVKDNHIPLNVDVASLAKFGGQLGKDLEIMNASNLRTNIRAVLEQPDTGDIIPMLSTVTKQETVDSFIFPRDVSLLHSDKSRGKSVWERISGRANPLLAGASSIPHGMVGDNSMPLSPAKVSAPNHPVNILSDAQDSGGYKDATKEFLVGFKRRRVNSGIAATNTICGKQRRKLTRPSFEVLAESFMEEAVSAQALGDNAEAVTENLPISSDNGTPNVLETLCVVERMADDGSIVIEHKEHEDEVMAGEVVENNGSGFNQEDADKIHQSGTLDLNLPTTCEQEHGVGIYHPNLKKSASDCGCSKHLTTILACSNIKIPSLPNTDKHVETLPDRESCPSLLVQDAIGAVSLSSENMHGHSLSIFDGPSINLQQGLNDNTEADRVITDQPGISCSGLKPVKEAPGDRIAPQSDKEGGSGLLQTCNPSLHLNWEFVNADYKRGSAASLDPCTPTKKFVGPFDDTKVVPNVSQDTDITSGGIPLSWIANGKELSNVKLQVSDSTEQASEEASSRDGTLSLDGGNLLNQVDLKSILQRGLQVSSIKLQLGPSPCLIFQLGDAPSGMDNQPQEGTIPSNQHEVCSDEHISDSSPMQK